VSVVSLVPRPGNEARVWLGSRMYLRRMAKCSPVSSLGDGNLTELYLGYVQINYKLKTDLQSCIVGKGLGVTHV